MMPEKRKTYDTVVVGGGHVGLYTAGRLAARGFDVALFEKKDFIGKRVVCTGIIGSEVFEHFDLPPQQVLAEIRKVRFYSPHGNTLDYEPVKPLARVVDRGVFNRSLEERAKQSGAKIHACRQIEKIRAGCEGIDIQVRTEGGEIQTLRAATLILATGVNYKLFGDVGLEAPQEFLNGAQVHLPYADGGWASVYTGRTVAPGAFAWAVPLETGRARVGLLTDQPPAPLLKNLLDRIRPDWRAVISESDFDLRPVVQRPIRKSFRDRVLVVGEAAGQIKTTTGGGIYYGLLGADLAVETLEKAFLKKDFSEKAFAPYDRLWKKKIGDELKFGYHFRKFITGLSDDQLEAFFGRMMKIEISKIAHRVAEFDWHKNFIFSLFKLPSVKKTFKAPF